MSESARTQIYDRLRAALADPPSVDVPPPDPMPKLDQAEKISRLAELMTAVHTEVVQTKRDIWLTALAKIIATKKIGTLLYGPETALAAELATHSPSTLENVDLSPYDGDVETFKKELFTIDAGITTTRGAIADRGALILWPTPQEPRLLSLVPPIHIAVLDADTIYGSLEEAMQVQQWSRGMPTNALLISGPSKTADIEFTLVFGVHGPKELVVIIREN